MKFKDLITAKDFSNNLLVELNSKFVDIIEQFNNLGFVFNLKILDVVMEKSFEILVVLNIYDKKNNLFQAEKDKQIIDPFFLIIKNKKLILTKKQIIDLVYDKCSYYLEKLKIIKFEKLLTEQIKETNNRLKSKKLVFKLFNSFTNIIIILAIIIGLLIIVFCFK